MSNWTVNIANTGIPALSQLRSCERQDEISRLLDNWKSYIPSSNHDGQGDVEDFLEQAYRLDAVLAEIPHESIYLTSNGSAKYIRISDAAEFRIEDIPNAVKYGPRMSTLSSIHEVLHPDPAVISDYAADSYHGLSVFRENAGRLVKLSGYADGEKQDMSNDVYDIVHSANLTHLLIKPVKVKRGLYDIRFSDNEPSLEAVHNTISSALEYAALDLFGPQDQFLVQEFVDMEYEYRLFVVNGEVVTGAGSIEEFTPLQNSGELFSPYVRRNRKEMSAVIDSPETVAKLVDFGEGVASDFVAENPKLKSFVMDVALRSDGTPLIIELNGLLNAGLFASNTRATVRALAEAYS